MSHENLIQRGDLLQRLLRGLEIKGQRAAALTLDTGVAPVVILEDLTGGLEDDPRAPAWFYSQRAAALAGELSIVAVINSGPDIAVVERIEFSCGASADFDVFTARETDILNATAMSEFCSWADTRKAGVPPLAGSVGSAIGGIAPIENMASRTRFIAGGTVVVIGPPARVILAPGKGLAVQCTSAAVAFQAGFYGRVAQR